MNTNLQVFNENFFLTETVDKNITFMQWICKYIDKKQPFISKVTFIGYKRIEKTMNIYFNKYILLKDISYLHIQNYFNYLKQERGNKNKTIKHQSGLIYPALKTAFKNGLIKQNPVDFLGPIKNEKSIPSFYTKKELKILFEKLKGHRAELAIKVAAFYGFRRSELIGLKWNSIDFINKKITVENKLLILNKEIISTNVLKTASSNRILPLLPDIEKELKAHKKNIDLQLNLNKGTYNHSFIEYVFVDNNGNLIRPSYVSQSLRTIIKTYKLKKIRFHDLRHSCASLLLSNGVGMKDIQEWLGHSNFKTTADIYSHINFASKIEAGKKISKSLSFDKNKNFLQTEKQLKQEIKQLKTELKKKQEQLKSIKQNTQKS